MDGLEELTLVFPNFGMVDLLHQLGVFVDEPRFPEYVGSSVFHLGKAAKSRDLPTDGDKNGVVGGGFSVFPPGCAVGVFFFGEGGDDSGAPHPLGELRVHHEVVDVFLRFGQLQLPGHHGHHQRGAAGALRAWKVGGGGDNGGVGRAGTPQKVPPTPTPTRGVPALTMMPVSRHTPLPQ